MMIWGLLPWFSLDGGGSRGERRALFWGYRSGQFADQERARYLPLRGEEIAAGGRQSGTLPAEVYALAGLMAALGLAARAGPGHGCLQAIRRG